MCLICVEGENVDWIIVTQDMEQWRDLVNNVKNLPYKVLTAVVINDYIFGDITSCSPLKFVRRFGRTCHHHHQALLTTCTTLDYCLAYSSTLKIEVIFSSETLVDFKRTTRRYMP
jgi:hypothetical protein